MKKKLVLKFNAIVGRDPLPEIEEITKRFSLSILSIEEESPIAGKRIKIVSVGGNDEGLNAMGREMIRFPAITAKTQVETT